MFSKRLQSVPERANDFSTLARTFKSLAKRTTWQRDCLVTRPLVINHGQHELHRYDRQRVLPCGHNFRGAVVPSAAFQSTSSKHFDKQYRYCIAAAYCGKGRQFNPKTDHFNFDPSTNEHWAGGKVTSAIAARAVKYPSGQDSFFVSQVGQTGAIALGVTDGVGGYMNHGIDSAAFSHGLCNNMAQYATDCATGDHLKPMELLQAGYTKVCNDRTIKGGGSTACIAIAEPQGNLEVVNLGDSGFLHIRLKAIHHYSAPQVHAFNTPFQLSAMPPKLLAQIENFGGSVPFADLPKDATTSDHVLRHGDVLVFATDGVWDNLSAQEVLGTVSREMMSSKAWINDPPESGIRVSKSLPRCTMDGEGDRLLLQTTIAIAVAREAKATSMNPKRNGPFAKAVQKSFPQENFTGGKVDDICVVIVIPVGNGRVRVLDFQSEVQDRDATADI